MAVELVKSNEATIILTSGIEEFVPFDQCFCIAIVVSISWTEEDGVAGDDDVVVGVAGERRHWEGRKGGGEERPGGSSAVENGAAEERGGAGGGGETIAGDKKGTSGRR
ncbi:hypothetical protein KY284_017065 [Solanum tuberosum]|nr:hypothetical protein KY284_017065 [Solanum tuberosum]